MDEKPPISKPALYGIMLGMLIFGTLNTLVMKYQDDTKAPISSGLLFTHPYLQCAFMFFGEFTCMGLYGLKMAYYSSKEKQGLAVPMSPGTRQADQVKQLTNINPLWIAIPASCDFLGSSLMFVALTMCPASVYQMMRGIIVVITALMSICFLGRKQYRHHWTGIVLIIVGVFSVGYASVAKEGGDSGDTQGSEVLGILLLLLSQCFAGTQFITEEKILGNYYLDPFRVVGTEGMWGLMYYLILLPVMQNIHCGGEDASGLGTLCNYDYLENSAFAFYQMG